LRIQNPWSARTNASPTLAKQLKAKSKILRGSQAQWNSSRSRAGLPSVRAIKLSEIHVIMDGATRGTVSGAARGIGLMAASALSEVGSHIFCLDILPEPQSESYALVRDLARSRGLAFEYRQANLTDESQVSKVFEGIWKDSRAAATPVQCYVHAAGIQHEVPLIDSTSAEFRRILEINTTGTFLSSQAAARVMRQHGRGGSIILVASMSGQIANRVCSPNSFPPPLEPFFFLNSLPQAVPSGA
jgi:short chain dehydrogenase